MIKEDKNETMRATFAKRLCALRLQHHHTQAHLASKLNISKSCISNYENGIRLPDSATLMQIAALYGVSVEYLIGSSKRPLHYVPEDKYIDKQRYLDLNKLCTEHQRMLKEFYEFLCTKDNH